MRLFGLIGYPLTHSFSADFFKQKFTTDNINDAEYRLFPLDSISELPELIKQQPDLQGFNVTIPYKVSILPLLNYVSKVASEAGAVNCVKFEREASEIKLFGFNTDVHGFRQSLLPLLKPNHYSALILGTGGAAKAVSYSLLELGISYTMVSRKRDDKTCMHYSQLTEDIINDNLLIINTSPVGMYPDMENAPDIPYQFIGRNHLLFDLIYNPAETLFLKKGREAGAVTKNGLQMLELQAEKSWEIWNS
jgi:shikimate dehydrogenase